MRIATPLAAILMLAGCAAEPPAITPAVAAAALAGARREPSPQAVGQAELFPPGPTPDEFAHLQNLLRVSGRIYSGGEPQGEEAFAEIARLGVRTVVSVDGARPDVEMAQRHGLRYVHIPIGYDGVSETAGKSLARLVRDAEGPFYIHCHHGEHRGPAAAAIACIADGAASGETALAILEKAGTSKAYGGLWRDVQGYTPPAADEELPELVAVAKVGSLAAAMAQIDRAKDNLKLCQAADWRTPSNHPDLAPAQEALLFKEGFRETVRQLEEVNDHDEQFLAWMREAEATAAAVEVALQAGDATAARHAFTSAQNQCQRCHGEYRN